MYKRQEEEEEEEEESSEDSDDDEDEEEEEEEEDVVAVPVEEKQTEEQEHHELAKVCIMGGRVSCESSSTMGQSAVGCHLCWWLRWRSNRGGVYFILRGDFSSKFCFVDKSARARVG